jgi:hypothetical protein
MRVRKFQERLIGHYLAHLLDCPTDTVMPRDLLVIGTQIREHLAPARFCPA